MLRTSMCRFLFRNDHIPGDFARKPKQSLFFLTQNASVAIMEISYWKIPTNDLLCNSKLIDLKRPTFARIRDQRSVCSIREQRMERRECCGETKPRTGLWSPEEDEKLASYIAANGHGSWSSVPKLAGRRRNVFIL